MVGFSLTLFNHLTKVLRLFYDFVVVFWGVLVFNFCRFCVVILFFHPRHNGQWLPTLKDFYTRSYNYWYHFYNVFVLTQSLTGYWTQDLPHSKPALYHSTTTLSRRRLISLWFKKIYVFVVFLREGENPNPVTKQYLYFVGFLTSTCLITQKSVSFVRNGCILQRNRYSR